jgi:hypothetical protein
MTTATDPGLPGFILPACRPDSFYCTFAAMRASAKLRRLPPVKALTVPFAITILQYALV